MAKTGKAKKNPTAEGDAGRARRKPTIKDIARTAEVSYSTAARILAGNTNYYIGKDTREKVLGIARELNYFPNPFARSLKVNRSQIIGICIHHPTHPPDRAYPEKHTQVSTDRRLEGIYRHPASDDYNVMIIRRDDEAGFDEQKLLRQVAILDGLIFISPLASHSGMINRLCEELPVVVEDWNPIGCAHTVSIDNRLGVYMAVECLAKHGCTRVGIVTMNYSYGYEYNVHRIEGFFKGVADFGLPSQKSLHVDANSDEGQYYRTVQKLLVDEPSLDGLIVTRDFRLIEAMQAIKDAGREIGSEIKLISINETNLCRVIPGGVSAIYFPIEDLAEQSFGMLIDSIDQHIKQPRNVLIKPVLNERATTLGMKSSSLLSY